MGNDIKEGGQLNTIISSGGEDYVLPYVKEDTITLDRNFLEHLLNCMCSQKFIDEAPPCGDAMAMNPEDYKSTQKGMQEIIDKAYHTARFIMSIKGLQEESYKMLINKYVEYWNINSDKWYKQAKEDEAEFPEDENIWFKWVHLLEQEIIMWAKLCSYSDAKVNEEKQTYEIAQVERWDFSDIIERRGFTPKMISALKDTLIAMGIGNQV